MTTDIIHKDIDVLVIGGGIAGTMAAIKAREAGAKNVVEVDKSRVGKSGNSCFAAGVIHVYFPGLEDFNDRLRRTCRCLGYIAQQDLQQDYLENIIPLVDEMDSWGVKFVRTADGKLERRPGRGFYPIISFYGFQLMDQMAKTVLKKGTKHINRMMITGLLTRDGAVTGAVGFDARTGEFHIFRSKATVLATGSTFYKGLCPGQDDISGDGYWMAYHAGAQLSGAENSGDQVTNFFPRTYDIGPGMNKWVGEGGLLVNRKGEVFMEKWNPKLKTQSSLRLMCAGFCFEARLGNTPIYMDFKNLTPENVARLRASLPLSTKAFERVGVIQGDKFVKPVEWSPMGPAARPGCTVNRDMATSLAGLYCCGEALAPQAATQGLGPAITSAARAGKSAALFAKGSSATQEPNAGQVQELRESTFRPMHRKDGIEPDQVLLALQEVIMPYDVLLLREESRMQKALEAVQDIRDNQVPLLYAYDPHYLRMANEVRSMVLVAEMQLKAAITRKESRTILREDYPDEDNVNWLKFINLKKDGDEMKFYTEDIPIEKYPLKVERKKTLHHSWALAEKYGIIKIEGGKVKWV